MAKMRIACAVVAVLWLCLSGPANAQTATRIKPSDLEYRGAFRLPDGPAEIGWLWCGQAMTYYPGGDPKGPDDGCPGSIFGLGHDWNQYVSEIGIPVPVISPTKNVNELHTAKTLQEFHNIRGNLFGPMEQMRAGLAYLPKQGRQTTDKLHFCWGQHMQEGEIGLTHGWCELDLSNPQPAGLWGVGNFQNYVTNDYIFEIPKEWADATTPGMRLATGRFREGGQGAQGPSLLAIGPWNDGNPPAPGTRLKAVPLLLYTDSAQDDRHTMNNYHHADEWTGAAWLTAGGKSVVIFAGTKGQGKCWYGFANGVVWPEDGPFPPIPDPPNNDRGWWSTGFAGQIMFYDPADLAAVAKGEKKPYEPQPYATLDIDKYLFHVKSANQKFHVGAVAFDRARGLLYLLEPFGDVNDKALLHVWKIKG